MQLHRVGKAEGVTHQCVRCLTAAPLTGLETL